MDNFIEFGNIYNEALNDLINNLGEIGYELESHMVNQNEEILNFINTNKKIKIAINIIDIGG